MKVIRRNATRTIAGIQKTFTACKRYEPSTGKMVTCDPGYAWASLANHRRAVLTESSDGNKYIVHVHSNLFYHLTKP